MVLYPMSLGNLGDPRCPEHFRCTRSLGSDKKLTLGSPLLIGGRVLKLDKILVYWKSWKSCEFVIFKSIFGPPIILISYNQGPDALDMKI